ncbi:MAG TPA: PfkB family carbohydrate kinase [Planctomycetota bacterium]|nr:PfkB family carbohydrate kinase [Planctomycetota bacterium]
MKILCFTPNPCIDQNYLAPGADWGGDATADSLEELASGKGVNWACNLGDLLVNAKPAPTELLSLAPIPDSLQSLYRARLRAHGVQPVFVDTQEPIRRHLTVIGRGRSLHLRVPGRPLSAAAWLRVEESLTPGRLIGPGDVLVIAGSFPPDAPLAKVKLLLGRLRDAGIKIWLDGSGAPLAALHSEATVIKINADEFRTWMKKEKRKTLARIIANALRALHQLTHLAVTDGADGAYLAFRNPGESTPLVIHGKLAAKSVVHPTGAGDCFGAALLWALSQSRQSPDALRLAIAAATTAVEKGPQNGLDPGEIRVRGAQVVIDEHPR